MKEFQFRIATKLLECCMCFRRWSDYVKELCTAVDDATSVHCGFDFHPALSDCTIEMSSQWERITTLCVTGVNFSPSTVHPTKLMIPHFFFVPGTLLPVVHLIQFIFVSWGDCWATTRGSLIWCPFMIVLIKFFHFFYDASTDWLFGARESCTGSQEEWAHTINLFFIFLLHRKFALTYSTKWI